MSSSGGGGGGAAATSTPVSGGRVAAVPFGNSWAEAAAATRKRLGLVDVDDDYSLLSTDRSSDSQRRSDGDQELSEVEHSAEQLKRPPGQSQTYI